MACEMFDNFEQNQTKVHEMFYELMMEAKRAPWCVLDVNILYDNKSYSIIIASIAETVRLLFFTSDDLLDQFLAELLPISLVGCFLFNIILVEIRMIKNALAYQFLHCVR